jgi:hypothetical protein
MLQAKGLTLEVARDRGAELRLRGRVLGIARVEAGLRAAFHPALEVEVAIDFRVARTLLRSALLGNTGRARILCAAERRTGTAHHRATQHVAEQSDRRRVCGVAALFARRRRACTYAIFQGEALGIRVAPPELEAALVLDALPACVRIRLVDAEGRARAIRRGAAVGAAWARRRKRRSAIVHAGHALHSLARGGNWTRHSAVGVDVAGCIDGATAHARPRAAALRIRVAPVDRGCAAGGHALTTRARGVSGPGRGFRIARIHARSVTGSRRAAGHAEHERQCTRSQASRGPHVTSAST